MAFLITYTKAKGIKRAPRTPEPQARRPALRLSSYQPLSRLNLCEGPSRRLNVLLKTDVCLALAFSKLPKTVPMPEKFK